MPVSNTKKAIFASGCFWGTQYYFDKAQGVVFTRAGFIGGKTENPTYEQVATGRTGHIEAVEVTYDPDETNFESLAKLFFETHDPTQRDGQGPDLGPQYRSAIFYHDDKERMIAQLLINELVNKRMDIATKLHPATTFWPANEEHQQYYEKNGGIPYCHSYKKLFFD